jgi:hypothetical protein
VPDWIVYYADGSDFTSEDGEPWDAPRRYVAAIAVPNIENGCDILFGYNFYCWHFDEGCWVQHNESALDDYLDLPGKEFGRLRGWYVSRGKFEEIRKRIKRDTRLPCITAGPLPRPSEEVEKES